MISPKVEVPASDQHKMDQVPDYPRYRARAHHQRRLAIHAGVSGLWRRLRSSTPSARDAGFWTG